MKAFDFDFETVLTVREQEERRIQQRLAREERKLQRMMGEVEQRQEDLREAREQMKSYQRGTIDVDRLLTQKQYLNNLEQQLTEETKTVQDQLHQVKKIREELVEAAKDRQAMERLKEQEWERYVDEYYQEEQQFIDDITQFMDQQESQHNLRELEND